MKFYKEGDKSQAICSDCGEIVSSTMLYRDVPFEGGGAVAKDILVGVCDKCRMVVSIPAQSTPAIAKAKKQAQIPVETKVPAVFVEILEYACYQLDSLASTELRKRLIMFYVHQYTRGQLNKDELLKIHESTISFAKKDSKKKRLSFKVTDAMNLEVQNLSDATHLGKTELIKSVVFKIKNNIIDAQATKQTISALKSFAAAATC